MPNGLQDAEAPKVISEMPSSVFLRQTAIIWGRRARIAAEAQSEDDGDNLLHAVRPSLPNLAALRAFAPAASSSRLRGGAWFRAMRAGGPMPRRSRPRRRLNGGFVGS